MLKTEKKPRQEKKTDTIPNQTRLMAEYMLNTYKERIKHSCAPHDNERGKDQTGNGFVQERAIQFLQKKVQEKTALIELLKTEMAANQHIAASEEHFRKKLEKENTALKNRLNIMRVAREEETTMISLAMTKYHEDKERYCSKLQEANQRIAALELDLYRAQKELRESHDRLSHTTEKAGREKRLRLNRDLIIRELEHQNAILKQTHKEQCDCFTQLRSHYRRREKGFRWSVSYLKEKLHYLEMTKSSQEKTIESMEKERKATENARWEESAALLHFLRQYRDERKKQREALLEMKKEGYAEGRAIGTLVQSL